MSAGRELAAVLVDALDHEALVQLADRLAPFMAERLELDRGEDRWMDSRTTAAYLGLPSVNALHKLHASDDPPPCHQAGPNAKRWYLRSELDAWRGSR